MRGNNGVAENARARTTKRQVNWVPVEANTALSEEGRASSEYGIDHSKAQVCFRVQTYASAVLGPDSGPTFQAGPPSGEPDTVFVNIISG